MIGNNVLNSKSFSIDLYFCNLEKRIDCDRKRLLGLKIYFECLYLQKKYASVQYYKQQGFKRAFDE
jgi:hypothetical protein